jgi:hypothetical protein
MAPQIDTTDPIAPPVPAFEETPEEIPSVLPPITSIPEQDYAEETQTPVDISQTPVDIPQTPVDIPQAETVSPSVVEDTYSPPVLPTPPQAIPATLPTSPKSLAPIIFIGLLLIAGVGLAASVFLFSQSAQLKKQLTDITQTLDRQNTTVTPTPTATPIEVTTPTPFPTPIATNSGFVTPSVTPTPSSSPSAMPLLYAKEALKVALNREPNAQLILIKTENASDPANSITKYFFRQDLTTKKYFYVTILDKGEPAIIDKAIYVTPDNGIPSLNETVSSENFGIDLDKALKLSYDACLSGICQTASLKSQFIKSGDNYIWQLSFTPTDLSKGPLIIQINSITKEVLYKSPGF